MDLPDRLRDVLPEPDRRGLQAELAALCRIKQPSVWAWFHGGASTMKRQHAEAICNRFAPQISPRWLAEGDGPKYLATALSVAEPIAKYKVAPATNPVPLVNWVAAGRFTEIGGISQQPETWYRCPVPHSPATFALRVRGISMFSPHGEPSFADGDVIFVDPEIQPHNKSLVVVRLDGEGEATFKRLLDDGADRMLEALNPAWPERFMRIRSDATICGVVIAKIVVY